MRFHFRPVLTIAVLIGLSILIGLGSWQVRRLQWKQDLIAKIEARVSAEPIDFADAYKRWLAGEDMEYTPVKAKLIYDHAREAHVFGTWESCCRVGIFLPRPISVTLSPIILIRMLFYMSIAGSRRMYTKRWIAARGSLIGSDDEGEYPVITGLLRSTQKVKGYASSLVPENNPQKNEWACS